MPRLGRIRAREPECERGRVGLPAERSARAARPGRGARRARRRPGPAEPLDAAADGEVDVERGHVERDRADGLVRVEDDVGADLVGALDDRLHVLDPPRLEDDVADRDEQRALVDRLDDRLLVGADDDLGTAGALRLLEIAHRREVLLLVDDAVPGGLEVEAGQDHGLGDRHVLVHHRRSGGAPMRRPIWSPTVIGSSHQPSPQARGRRACSRCARTRRGGAPPRPASGRASG